MRNWGYEVKEIYSEFVPNMEFVYFLDFRVDEVKGKFLYVKNIHLVISQEGVVTCWDHIHPGLL